MYTEHNSLNLPGRIKLTAIYRAFFFFIYAGGSSGVRLKGKSVALQGLSVWPWKVMNDNIVSFSSTQTLHADKISLEKERSSYVWIMWIVTSKSESIRCWVSCKRWQCQLNTSISREFRRCSPLKLSIWQRHSDVSTDTHFSECIPNGILGHISRGEEEVTQFTHSTTCDFSLASQPPEYKNQRAPFFTKNQPAIVQGSERPIRQCIHSKKNPKTCHNLS